MSMVVRSVVCVKIACHLLVIEVKPLSFINDVVAVAIALCAILHGWIDAYITR